MAERPQSSVEANARWFEGNDGYAAAQSRLAHYQYIARMVDHELRGVGRLLDVGNGGFVNYDVALPRHVTAVDLFVADGPGPAANTRSRQGSLLALPFSDQSFNSPTMPSATSAGISDRWVTSRSSASA
jgi:hypothetical protein